MGKKTEPHSIRIRVCPPSFDENGDRYAPEQLFQMAATLANEIRDRVPGADMIEVAFENAVVCEFCGALWGDPELDHNNGCCLDDETHRQPMIGDLAPPVQVSPHVFEPYGFRDRFSQYGRCKHCLWPKRRHPVEGWAPARALEDGRRALILPPTEHMTSTTT